MIELKQIQTNDLIPVRHAVLRKGLPVESCHFQEDNLSTTIHFGAFVDKKIVGCATVIKNRNSNFDTENQYQLRGMAVLDDFQKQGVGEKYFAFANKTFLFQTLFYGLMLGKTPFHFIKNLTVKHKEMPL